MPNKRGKDKFVRRHVEDTVGLIVHCNSVS